MCGVSALHCTVCTARAMFLVSYFSFRSREKSESGAAIQPTNTTANGGGRALRACRAEQKAHAMVWNQTCGGGTRGNMEFVPHMMCLGVDFLARTKAEVLEVDCVGHGCRCIFRDFTRWFSRPIMDEAAVQICSCMCGGWHVGHGGIIIMAGVQSIRGVRSGVR